MSSHHLSADVDLPDMTKDEQLDFVFELTQRLQEEVSALIENNSIPASWSGKQLHWFLYDRLHPQYKMNHVELRQYHNDILENNL